MSVKRIQNKIADSRLALPVTAIYAVLVCLISDFITQHLWAQFAILIVSTYMMLELNNTNALIRIYSRMVSCSYLMLAVMAHFLLVSVPYGMVQLLFIGFLLLFFRCYQDKRAAGTVFYAYTMLGAASLFFVQVLYFVPIIWILLRTNIMAGNVRTLSASIIGLLMPYWCVGGYYLYAGETDLFLNHFTQLWQLAPLADFSILQPSQMVSLAFIALVDIIGIIHFHRNSYKDKIRTRMLFEVFTTFSLCIMAFIVLQPQHTNFLLSMLLVCASPMIAHFISLTHTRITNIIFIVLLISVVSITACNLWLF